MQVTGVTVAAYGAELPQKLKAYTLIWLVVAPTITLSVDVPWPPMIVQPVGTIQKYDKPATGLSTAKVVAVLAQTEGGAMIPATAAGALFTVIVIDKQLVVPQVPASDLT
jgi:hypothetical protein